MPNLIQPSTLRNPSAAPIQDMIDAVENRCADFVVSKGTLPRYLYLNDRFWRDIQDLGLLDFKGDVWGFIRTVMTYGLEPVTHPDIPYSAAGLYDTYLDPAEVAKRLKEAVSDVAEYEAKGLISVG